jgi:glycerol-3-phosphate O-acyltransferase
MTHMKQWLEDSRRCFCENLYIGQVPLYGLMRDLLSTIAFKEDYATALKKLGDEGIVVYALKDRSHLNTLILYDLALRQGIPRPTFAHDVNMILWQPVSQALGAVFSCMKRLFSRRFRNETRGVEGLAAQVSQGNHAVIHLGGSEFFENKGVEGVLSRLMDLSEASERPIYVVPMLIAYGRRREKENENAINILFGQAESTGVIRRVVTFIRYASKIIVIPTAPVPLAEYVKKGGMPYPARSWWNSSGRICWRASTRSGRPSWGRP